MSESDSEKMNREKIHKGKDKTTICGEISSLPDLSSVASESERTPSPSPIIRKHDRILRSTLNEANVLKDFSLSSTPPKSSPLEDSGLYTSKVDLDSIGQRSDVVMAEINESNQINQKSGQSALLQLDVKRVLSESLDTASRSPSPIFKKNQRRQFDTKMTKSSLLKDFQLSSSTSEDGSPHSNLAPDQDRSFEEAEGTSESVASKIDIEKCIDCALHLICSQIEKHGMIEMKANFTCTCLCLDKLDSVERFSSLLFQIICDSPTREVDNLIEKTMFVVEDVMMFSSQYLPSFLCKMLSNLSRGTQSQQHKFIQVCRSLLSPWCLSPEFSTMLIKNRQARRSILKCLASTGSMFIFKCIIEFFYVMHKFNVDLTQVLPENMQFILDYFSDGHNIEEDEILHDRFIEEISLKVLDNVFNCENIVFLKMTKKEFYSKSGEKVEFDEDLMAYIDKKRQYLCHFLHINDGCYFEETALNDLQMEKEEMKLFNFEWVLFFEKADIFNLVSSFEDPSVEPSFVKEVDTDPCDIREHQSLEQVVHTSFTVSKETVLVYWDRRSDKHKFLAGICGKQWPKMYGSPCVVIMGYNRVKISGSQKRSCVFGKVKGKCKVCNASHTYEILESPFAEGTDDVPEKDMVVNVTIIGNFHSKEDGSGEPDVTNPVHDKRKASGYQLRGKDRKLIADRATEIGVKETYLEQLDSANLDELKKVGCLK